MRAGKLDRVITIARAATSVDAYGVPSSTWGTVYRLRAAVIEATANELIRDHGASTERRLKFRTWWRPGISVADRLTFDGAAFNIVAVEEVERSRELILTAERIGP